MGARALACVPAGFLAASPRRKKFSRYAPDTAAHPPCKIFSPCENGNAVPELGTASEVLEGKIPPYFFPYGEFSGGASEGIETHESGEKSVHRRPGTAAENERGQFESGHQLQAARAANENAALMCGVFVFLKHGQPLRPRSPASVMPPDRAPGWPRPSRRRPAGRPCRWRSWGRR